LTRASHRENERGVIGKVEHKVDTGGGWVGPVRGNCVWKVVDRGSLMPWGGGETGMLNRTRSGI